MADIVVLGSFMMDLVARSKRLPQNGETIVGNTFERNAGGKGANQAASIAKLGKEVSFIGMVGRDDFGEMAKDVLKGVGVDTEHLLNSSSISTGIGSVWVDEDGNNRIIIIPGSNLAFSSANLHEVEKVIKSAKILILQLEMDFSLILEAINMAYAYQVLILLNPAPARKLSRDVYKKVTYLTPNETELEILSGMPTDTIENVKAAANSLIRQGTKNIIVTLGDRGSVWVSQDGEVIIAKSKKVTAVDTVAAGDSFNGALACGIIDGLDKREVLDLANTVGALTVTKNGAIQSLPTLNDVRAFIQNENDRK
ncbi:ribokinase [Enterococcus massiliensis]|uniref:ribokinase n=1 Tax=Enterococcus massiliensis TaxID=1640685 RepID=UPI00065E1408|nr:ribokinase [Enterococcus massiliensis]